jgi:hypothetical protein
MVGFTCYLWNIERTLWIAGQLKSRRLDLRVILGGPEITADNAWVLDCPAVDYATIGEGEQTFVELLQALLHRPAPEAPIDGLYVSIPHSALRTPHCLPRFRTPLANLDEISSPYLEGILDAADEQMLLLETIRGCVFKCKFCYYPKSYDALYFLSQERLIANLRHARQRGAREVVLLDPTLNQRRDFDDFLRLLVEHNPDGQFTYFGELRAEGINAATARLLRQANFSEVEIGLQSIDPAAQELMDRKNNLRAFERGVRAMLDEGIKVKVDLIIGLPGDTRDSVRRGLDYLHASGLYSSMQVFNLAVLPGTAFRQEADSLGLEFQPRPPYYVTETPTLSMSDMLELMEEAQELFGIEFDPLPPPALETEDSGEAARVARFDLDHRPLSPVAHDRPGSGIRENSGPMVDADSLARARPWAAGPSWAEFPRIPLPERRSQAFTLWLKSSDFHAQRHEAAELVGRLLEDNPFTTLQVVLEQTGDPGSITPQLLERLTRVCYHRPTYLDKFYAVLPGPPKGAKRLVVVLPLAERARLGEAWIDAIGQYATLAWRGPQSTEVELEAHEYVLAPVL